MQHPSHRERQRQRQMTAGLRESSQDPGPSQSMNSAALSAPGLRSEDSWIEVSSRPSSSSVSSAADEIITTGLRVQHDPRERRRRRFRRATSNEPNQSQFTNGSSPDEVEDSESESDRAMSSSNEGRDSLPAQASWANGNRPLSSSPRNLSTPEHGDDDDENATAIGAPSSVFTPQPNAFSHPPAWYSSRQRSEPRPWGSRQRYTRSASEGHTFPGRQVQHSPYNVISPSYQADHDAALRASLSTLLSCAAAARGLPKSERETTRGQNRAQIDPSTLRLISGSELDAMNLDRGPAGTADSIAMASVNPVVGDDALVSTGRDKGKRRASSGTANAPLRSGSKERRLSKKARRTSTPATPATMDEVAPTLLTWVMSAGVVVLVSAISFSAGYVAGREAGKAEVAGHFREAAAGSGSFGRGMASESRGAGLGLRKFRWTSASAGARA